MSQENNKRIVKNTVMLYFRMLLTMFITLYTSRIVLSVLGVVDYGVYNVIGGVISMLSFLNGAMAVATQRFLTFELGRKDYDQLKKIFSMSITIYVLIALILFILAETVGLWILNSKLVIPAERLTAANWVYQFSILIFIFNMLIIPYTASIISHEKMNIYAYISILEVVLKLLLVYLLVIISYDKLIVYGLLLLLATIITSLIYIIYCRVNFKECKYQFFWDKPLFVTLVSYSGWNLFGSFSGLAKNQAINILLNLFFGPVINTSRSIAVQVNQAINSFVQNFYTAVRPQITKYYAGGNLPNMFNLVISSSKLSYYLILLLSMPVLFRTSYIINLWLNMLPDYVVLFTRLFIVNALIDAFSNPLMTVAQSTGKIKLYQFVVGTLIILNVPVAYFFLKLGFSPEITIYVSISISVIAFFARLWIVKRLVDFPVARFLKEVILTSIIVTVAAYFVPVMVNRFFMDETIVNFLIMSFICVTSCSFSIYFLGINRSEKEFINGFIKKKICRKK